MPLLTSYYHSPSVIIVLRDSDPELETVYRNEIRENLGVKVPTRVVTVGSVIDDFKRTEIHHISDELIEEILARKKKEQKAKKAKEKQKVKKKTESKKKPAKKKKK